MFESIVEAVFRHAAQHPDRLCLADDDSRISYGEYAERIQRYAAAFSSEGIAPGDRVVVEACQRIDYLAIGLALQLNGAVSVPVEHNCAPNKIQMCIRDRPYIYSPRNAKQEDRLISFSVCLFLLGFREEYKYIRYKSENHLGFLYLALPSCPVV